MHFTGTLSVACRCRNLLAFRWVTRLRGSLLDAPEKTVHLPFHSVSTLFSNVVPPNPKRGHSRTFQRCLKPQRVPNLSYAVYFGVVELENHAQ